MKRVIRIRGAREHNLKNVNIDIPRDQLVVLTGLSGSGKSSLAFDTIYAEGQRRYVESLSAYARMFLGQMQKPDLDSIEGLSPAISIDQKTTSHNPRSTVGTVTEVYDYLRLLFARVGQAYCPKCGRPIEQLSLDQIVERIEALGIGTAMMLLAPVVRGRKGTYAKLFQDFVKEGFMRVRVDGEIYTLDQVPSLDKNIKHDIELVVDRLILKEETHARLADSTATALKYGGGLCLVSCRHKDAKGQESWTDQLFSEHNVCPHCNVSLGDITPQLFSFNNPHGACPSCTGLGQFDEIDPKAVVSQPMLSLNEGAITVQGFNIADPTSWTHSFIASLSEYYGFSMDTPWEELSEDAKHLVLFGNDKKIPVDTSNSRYARKKNYKAKWQGIIPGMKKRLKEGVASETYADYMMVHTCDQCHGARLRPEALSVRINNKNIAEVCELPLKELKDFLEEAQHQVTDMQQKIVAKVFDELEGRLKFLIDVGLDYMNLGRASSTLSGGEAQRIRLATQIGSGLTGVLYILDEPSIGLHQRDNARLLATLKHLRDLGNSVLVVEHDEETMGEADFIIDMGPGAGELGGEVVASGSYDELCENKASLTGKYLSGRARIYMPQQRRKPRAHWIEVIGAHENNLKHCHVKVPLGVLTCVTGVSGSGKSSLVNGILLRRMQAELNGARQHDGHCEAIHGVEYLDRVIAIDQSPIGRTPRSNPATYTGVFTLIRELFAGSNLAKQRGYAPGRFSFNVKGGRCEACGGDGVKRIEMHFLPDVYVTCDVCHGERYNRETLDVTYKGKNISEVLNMTVTEALAFFEHVPKIRTKLQTLEDVGLGYIRLGQPSTQLSGGEAQRVKLASELSRRSSGNDFYILDEPTTGLHMDDVRRLIDILQRLVDGGNTVLVIEHNLDVIKCSDYIIDLGPEGGAGGGQVIAVGTPEEVSECSASYTGHYLRALIARERLRDEKEGCLSSEDNGADVAEAAGRDGEAPGRDGEAPGRGDAALGHDDAAKPLASSKDQKKEKPLKKKQKRSLK